MKKPQPKPDRAVMPDLPAAGHARDLYAAAHDLYAALGRLEIVLGREPNGSAIARSAAIAAEQIRDAANEVWSNALRYAVGEAWGDSIGTLRSPRNAA